MTNKELKRLGREELLEMLIQQSKEMDDLRAKMDEMQNQLEEAQKKVKDREIAIHNAGSIAEASLQLSGVFEAAQDAAAQYLENIKSLSDRQQELCEKMEAETRAKCDAMLSQTESECLFRQRAVDKHCQAALKELRMLLGTE